MPALPLAPTTFAPDPEHGQYALLRHAEALDAAVSEMAGNPFLARPAEKRPSDPTLVPPDDTDQGRPPRWLRSIYLEERTRPDCRAGRYQWPDRISVLRTSPPQGRLLAPYACLRWPAIANKHENAAQRPIDAQTQQPAQNRAPAWVLANPASHGQDQANLRSVRVALRTDNGFARRPRRPPEKPQRSAWLSRAHAHRIAGTTLWRCANALSALRASRQDRSHVPGCATDGLHDRARFPVMFSGQTQEHFHQAPARLRKQH